MQQGSGSNTAMLHTAMRRLLENMLCFCLGCEPVACGFVFRLVVLCFMLSVSSPRYTWIPVVLPMG